MSTQEKVLSLSEEIKSLHQLQRALADKVLINLLIGDQSLTSKALNHARWGIYSSLGSRLREIHQEINDLKKGEIL